MYAVHTFILSALLLLSTSQIQLNGTSRLPSASGETKVETLGGSKRLLLHVSGMKPGFAVWWRFQHLRFVVGFS